MARKPRVRAKSGIYHVLMQGVRHRDLFLDEEDYMTFADVMLRTMASEDEDASEDTDGEVKNFRIHAYCLMPDHFQLLLEEGAENVSKAMLRIATSYSNYFNNKYDRDGAIYRTRFASEPVEDEQRFELVLRYIHQYPLKKGLVENMDDYINSSWHEYMGEEGLLPQLCEIREKYRQMTEEEVREWLCKPISKSSRCLSPRATPMPRPSDQQVWRLIYEWTGAGDQAEFMGLSPGKKTEILISLRKKGASIRQLERLTGIGRGIIQNL